ncbi:restriction endonuclease subunit S [Akkermansia muciniphila]|uniref:restriction endonuclease subunit S n=1 Tax=Akkermansia muciniphila TaxID=239935 RepID=UPI0033B7C207
MKYNLSDICDYVRGKVDVASLGYENYISTENMISNKGGITSAYSLPCVAQTQSFQVGDVLVSNIRPYFKKIWFAEFNGGCSNDVLVLRAKDGISKKFLYYVLTDDTFFNYSMITSKGTKMPRGDKAAIMKYEVPEFTYKEQEKIARILEAFDEKIQLNSNINDNLLEQMKVLYKFWFVDFAPFDSTKPESWVQTDIYELANIIYGAPFKSKLFNTDGIGKPIIRIRDLKDQQFATYTTEVHPKGYLLQPGDIVVGMDGEFRPYIWGNDEAWLNQRVCVFENKRPNGKAFLYFTIKPLLHAIEQTQVATTVIHIGKKDFDAFEIALPDTSTLDDFDTLTAPMIRIIVSNIFENKKLAVMRDILLPKLMSGEIDVSNIQI